MNKSVKKTSHSIALNISNIIAQELSNSEFLVLRKGDLSENSIIKSRLSSIINLDIFLKQIEMSIGSDNVYLIDYKFYQ